MKKKNPNFWRSGCFWSHSGGSDLEETSRACLWRISAIPNVCALRYSLSNPSALILISVSWTHEKEIKFSSRHRSTRMEGLLGWFWKDISSEAPSLLPWEAGQPRLGLLFWWPYPRLPHGGSRPQLGGPVPVLPPASLHRWIFTLELFADFKSRTPVKIQ